MALARFPRRPGVVACSACSDPWSAVCPPPRSQVIHRLVCDLAPTCSRWACWADVLPSLPGRGCFPWFHRGVEAGQPALGPTERAHETTLSTTDAQDFRHPVDNPVHSSFVLVHGIWKQARKKIFGILLEVIHRRTPKSVDNPVDNLWISAFSLWATKGLPVDALLGHPTTKPQSDVDNLGKNCGRSCGQSVDNLGTLLFVHSPPELPTGSSTGPVDKKTSFDLRGQWLSTLSTGPTTTAHLL